MRWLLILALFGCGVPVESPEAAPVVLQAIYFSNLSPSEQTFYVSYQCDSAPELELPAWTVPASRIDVKFDTISMPSRTSLCTFSVTLGDSRWDAKLFSPDPVPFRLAYSSGRVTMARY